MRSYINSEKFSAYSSHGLLVRLMFDVLITNVGMAVGLMLTLILWIHKNPLAPGYFKIEMIKEYWIINIPVLSLAARQLRDELAHDRVAGGHREDSIKEAAGVD